MSIKTMLNERPQNRVQVIVNKSLAGVSFCFVVPDINVDQLTMQRLIKANNGDKNAAIAVVLHRSGVKVAREILDYVDAIDSKVQIPATETITL